MSVNRQTIEQLKQADMYFAAGAVAKAMGLDRGSYGAHFGFRSTLERDRGEFQRGWDQAPASNNPKGWEYAG